MHTTHPWEKGPKLSSTQIKIILEENIPDLPLHTVKRLGDGWDNTTWLVNNEWVFRFPKHDGAAGLLLNEIKTLPHLQNLSVNIPNPSFTCLDPKGYPFPIYGHSFLHGQSVDRADLSVEQRAKLAEPLGLLLKNLHAFPLEKAYKMGITTDSIERFNHKKRLDAVNTSFHYLKKHNLIDETDLFIEAFNKNLDLPVPDKLVLSHGDLYAKHILLDKNQDLCAIIDWGDCELMSPAIDLRMAYQLLPCSSHAVFWTAYGSTDAPTKELAKILSIHSASSICWYAHQVGDNPLLKEGLKGLSLIKEFFLITRKA